MLEENANAIDGIRINKRTFYRFYIFNLLRVMLANVEDETISFFFDFEMSLLI